MILSILKLHLAQAGKSLQKAKNNSYSDREKQTYQDNLIRLFEKIEQEVNAADDATDEFCFEKKQIVDFIYKSLEFLDSSTLNLIPYETVECLNLALNDWVKPDERYVIVTSLINEIFGFSFDPSLVEVDGLYNLFVTKYKIDFQIRLVQINIPKSLSKDYLASVVHYHELGHFIDTKYFITDSIAMTISAQWIRHDSSLSVLTSFLPFLSNRNYLPQNIQFLLKYHLGEYFCDLFASQYVGDSLNNYLLYIDERSGTYSNSHPSSLNRSKVVNDFLKGNPNGLVDLINDSLSQILGKSFEILYREVPKDDFYNFLPPVIEDNYQLHGLLSTGWQVWCEDWEPFKKEMKMSSMPEATRIYTIINNLIEKSIGNFSTERQWMKVK